MRKKRILAVLFLMTAILAGCKKEQENVTPIKEEEQKEEMNGQAEPEPTAESVKETKEGEPERGSILLEDEDAIYLCGSEKVCKVNKEENTSQILWEKEIAAEKLYPYSAGSALLLQDNIYFIENGNENELETQKKAVSVVGTDGTGYQRLVEAEGYDITLFWMDSILYVSSHNDLQAYNILENGGLQKIDSDIILKQYESILHPYVNGKYLSLPESQNAFGYFLIINDDNRLVKVDPETGEETEVLSQGDMVSYNKKYILSYVYDYDREHISLYLTDIKTLETSLFAEREGNINILDMDEEYVYITIEDTESKVLVYERISLESGEWQKLFEQERILGMGLNDFYMQYALRPIIKNGFLYYADASDYKIYIMRRDLEYPKTAGKVGDAYYDSRISEVGSVELYEEAFYSQTKPDFLLSTVQCERLVVDSRFAGAEKINNVLKGEMDGIIKYATPASDDYREEEIGTGQEPDNWMQYSYGSGFTGISYFDGNILSFCEESYSYEGGAHGMPYWVGYTFDLQTGEKLSLKELIGNSEQELKDIVTKYFAEYINQNPDVFWEDAVDSVSKGTNYDSNFFLTKEGIKFYYGPYELASYAAGFQSVIIPYEEFDMKILPEQ